MYKAFKGSVIAKMFEKFKGMIITKTCIESFGSYVCLWTANILVITTILVSDTFESESNTGLPKHATHIRNSNYRPVSCFLRV